MCRKKMKTTGSELTSICIIAHISALIFILRTLWKTQAKHRKDFVLNGRKFLNSLFINLFFRWCHPRKFIFILGYKPTVKVVFSGQEQSHLTPVFKESIHHNNFVVVFILDAAAFNWVPNECLLHVNPNNRPQITIIAWFRQGLVPSMLEHLVLDSWINQQRNFDTIQ